SLRTRVALASRAPAWTRRPRRAGCAPSPDVHLYLSRLALQSLDDLARRLAAKDRIGTRRERSGFGRRRARAPEPENPQSQKPISQVHLSFLSSSIIQQRFADFSPGATPGGAVPMREFTRRR